MSGAYPLVAPPLTVQALDESLKDLVEWEMVATQLPEMTQPEIETIVKDHPDNNNKQKLVLYRTWLRLCPNATWNDVIQALVKAKEMTLAHNIKQRMPNIAKRIDGDTEKLADEETIVPQTQLPGPPPIYYLMQGIIATCEVIQADGPPTIYKLSVRQVMKRGRLTKMEFGHPLYPPKQNKVLMLVGATGAGKSTLINGMINFIFGVKWENDFRFKLIHDEISQSQAHSQTQSMTAYTFHWQKGSPIDYTLTVLDTPGFGDTRGIERDREITELIREFFSLQGKQGLDVLDGIGFVTQAPLARLTPTQKYISSSILSIFGKDIKDNIFMLITFADGADPPVMQAIKEAQIPYAEFFRFNNSALYARFTDSEFSKMFWEIGHSSFSKFFQYLLKAKPVSLQMTRQVLEERRHLETIVHGFQLQINQGLAKIDELKQEEEN